MQSKAKSARRQRLQTESALISTTLESSDEAKEAAAERLQTHKLFPTDFVPQPSWSSDKEEVLVSFLLLYSTSHSWTFRRTDVSLCIVRHKSKLNTVSKSPSSKLGLLVL